MMVLYLLWLASAYASDSEFLCVAQGEQPGDRLGSAFDGTLADGILVTGAQTVRLLVDPTACTLGAARAASFVSGTHAVALAEGAASVVEARAGTWLDPVVIALDGVLKEGWERPLQVLATSSQLWLAQSRDRPATEGARDHRVVALSQSAETLSVFELVGLGPQHHLHWLGLNTVGMAYGDVATIWTYDGTASIESISAGVEHATFRDVVTSGGSSRGWLVGVPRGNLDGGEVVLPLGDWQETSPLRVELGDWVIEDGIAASWPHASVHADTIAASYEEPVSVKDTGLPDEPDRGVVIFRRSPLGWDGVATLPWPAEVKELGEVTAVHLALPYLLVGFSDAAPSGTADAGAIAVFKVDVLDKDEDGASEIDDCDDLDAAIGPSAEELAANGVDDDCDGLVDEVPSDSGESDSDEAQRDSDVDAGDTDNAFSSPEGGCGCANPAVPTPDLRVGLGLLLLCLVRRRAVFEWRWHRPIAPLSS